MQWLILFCLFFVGCNQKKARRELMPINIDVKNPSKIFKLKEEPIHPGDVARQRVQKEAAYELSDLGSNFQRDFFEGVEGAMYVLPVLHFYGGVTLKERVKRTPYGDGFEKIEIPVKLVSPLHANLPASLQFKDANIAEGKLFDETGKDVDLKAMAGCLSDGIIRFKGQTYDGKFKGENCGFQKPLLFEVHIPVETAHEIFESNLQENPLQFEGLLSAKKNISIGKYTLEIDFKELFKSQKGKLDSKRFWTRDELEARLFMILSIELGKMNVAALVPYQKIVNEIIEKMTRKSNEGYVFVRSNFHKELKFSFDKVNLEDFKEEQNFSIKTQLQFDSNYKEVLTLDTDKPVRLSMNIGYDDDINIIFKKLTGDTLVQTYQKTRKDNNVEIPLNSIGCRNYGCELGGNTRVENQWIDTYNYSVVKEQLVQLPVKYSQLSVVSDGRNCPVHNGETFKSCIERENVQLQNDYHHDVELKSGREVVDWKGTVLERAKSVRETSSTQLELEVILKNARLINY